MTAHLGASWQLLGHVWWRLHVHPWGVLRACRRLCESHISFAKSEGGVLGSAVAHCTAALERSVFMPNPPWVSPGAFFVPAVWHSASAVGFLC